MTSDIALILGMDGIASGAIYVLVGLGLVLIFSVTRVVFVPFGDIVAFSALTLASLQLGRTPGTVYLVAVLAIAACIVDSLHYWRRGQPHRIGRSLLGYGVLPLIPASIAWLVAGAALPSWAQIPLTIALVVPIAPLIDRIALQPIADASVLLLLIVSVALHFCLSGLGLLFFGPEGFRTEPLTSEIFSFGDVVVTSQTLLMIAAAAVFSLMLFLFFEYTLAGKALRATAVNRTGARIVGIRPASAGTLAFLLASLLGAISGILIGPVTTLYYDSGFLIGLKAFVGAIIGGLSSYPVTAIGAILVGILESFASFWSSALKEVVVFTFLIPVLLWRSLTLGHVEEEDEEVEG
ncbi:branched-chain amino acid ABC transporter permease [Microvirga yunnanensis]|uniref:branched-chain amino acid ABC transporter permease n=1 Tax=Microvirga yunnanensis TaxID=2953740 RepID=UPI0021C86438|nr:branched-chain amino acid ABC transporter permease [Microvirga sp. HBU65207]